MTKALLVILLAGLCGRALAADFYEGKTLKVVVGAAPGGAFDMYARLLAKYMPLYLPGKPDVQVQDMPGAGGRKAISYLLHQPADGTVIGSFHMSAVLAPVYDLTSPQYEMRSLFPLGSASTGTRVCVMTTRSGITKLEDAQKREVVVGADGRGSAPDTLALMLNKFAGTRFKIITGYAGAPEVLLAMERGEIEGMCAIEWTSLIAQRPAWLSSKDVSFILQVGPRREELPGFGMVPDMRDYIGQDDREVAELLITDLALSRFYAISSDVLSKRALLLRHAFMAALKDDGLRDDAIRMHLTIDPIDGLEAQHILERVTSAPPQILERAKWAISPK